MRQALFVSAFVLTTVACGGGGGGSATPTPPTISISAPAAGAVLTGARALTVTGAVSGQGTLSVSLTVNGGAATPATVADGGFSGQVTLADGANAIAATVTGDGGTATASVQVTYAPPVPPPTIAITSPTAGQQRTGGRTITVTGTAAGQGALAVTLAVNGETATPATLSGGAFSGQVTLRDGANTITATATGDGGSTPASVQVTYVPAPTVAVTAPAAGAEVTGTRTIAVTGTVAGVGPLAVVLSVDDGPVTLATVLDGTFSGEVTLADGANEVVATVTGPGGSSSAGVQVTFVPPPTIAITAPTADHEFTGNRTVAVAGTVAGVEPLSVALSVDGGPASAATVSGGAFTGEVALADGANVIEATVHGVGGDTSATVQVSYVPPPTITITAPVADAVITGSPTILVAGTIAGAGALTVDLSVNGAATPAPSISGGTFTQSVTLASGATTITATVTGTGGSTSATVQVTYVPAPTISITTPAPSQVITGCRTSSEAPCTVAVTGTIAGVQLTSVALSVNGGPTTTATLSGGTFTGNVVLADGGPNAITATVTGLGGSASADVQVTYPFLALQQFQAASLVLGQGDFESNGANRGRAEALDTMKYPYGDVGWDGTTLYVPDFQDYFDSSTGRVLAFTGFPTQNGAPARFELGHGAGGPSATAWGSTVKVQIANGKFFVVDWSFHRVLILDAPPTSGGAAASVAVGQGDIDEIGLAPEDSGLWEPEGLWVADGKLIVADTGHHRVLIWNTIPTQSGQPADLVLGQSDRFDVGPNGSSDTPDEPDGTPSASTFLRPNDVWSDGTRLVVADGLNHRVLVWNSFPTVDDQPATFVLGQPSNTTNAPGAGRGGLFAPYRVTSNGNQLFVADTENQRVLVWNAFPSAPALPDLVLGQSDFDHTAANDDDQDGASDGHPSARTLFHPDGVTAIDQGLIVSDSNNHRVLVFTP